jgi:hypothetical protein
MPLNKMHIFLLGSSDCFALIKQKTSKNFKDFFCFFSQTAPLGTKQLTSRRIRRKKKTGLYHLE